MVESKVRSYRPDSVDGVMAILDGYDDSSSTEQGRARVQLVVSTPADGSREALRDFAGRAGLDYRDVIASAEYPLEIKTRPLAGSDPTPGRQRELETIREQDRGQYPAWLRGTQQ